MRVGTLLMLTNQEQNICIVPTLVPPRKERRMALALNEPPAVKQNMYDTTLVGVPIRRCVGMTIPYIVLDFDFV